MSPAPNATRPDFPAQVPFLRVALAVLASGVLFGVLLFVPAGRLDWSLGWIYLAVFLANTLINWACLARWNPELIARRMRRGEGTKTWDNVWAVLFAPVMIAVYLVAGLDARDGVSSAWALLPALLAVAGIATRTALEDRTLHAELPGYPEYAARVRHRLVPGVW